MHCSTIAFLLLVTAFIVVSTEIAVIPLGTELTNIYCLNVEGEPSQLLDTNNYTVSTDDPLAEMREVSFTTCNLTYIPRTFLGQFVTAEQIVIMNSGIQTITSDDLCGNVNLKILYAGFNALTELPSYLFNCTPKIEEISFEMNKIGKIDPNAFAVGVEYLKKIDLSWNYIKTLDWRTFANVVSLKYLDFELNPIEEFGTEIIQPGELQYFDENKTDALSKNCLILPFQHGAQLTIHLSSNKLMNIEMNCTSDTRYLLNTTDNYDIKINDGNLHLQFSLHSKLLEELNAIPT